MERQVGSATRLGVGWRGSGEVARGGWWGMGSNKQRAAPGFSSLCLCPNHSCSPPTASTCPVPAALGLIVSARHLRVASTPPHPTHHCTPTLPLSHVSYPLQPQIFVSVPLLLDNLQSKVGRGAGAWGQGGAGWGRACRQARGRQARGRLGRGTGAS